MSRPRKSLIERLHPTDLAYAVDRLITQGKATVGEILRYAAERPARIEALERELRALRQGQGPTKVSLGRVAGRRGLGKAGRYFRMTPKMRAARKLQGRYLGLLRSLTADNRSAVKRLAQQQGVAAAVKEAERRRPRPTA